MKDWKDQIDANTTEFIQHFGPLSNEELNWKPDQETWSIAQNIDHLMVINKSYFPLLSRLRSSNLKEAMVNNNDDQITAVGNAILESVRPDRKNRTKTFPIWEPRPGPIAGDVLATFSNHQNDLKNEIEQSKALLESNAVIASPANKDYRYKLETAFDIIVAHEQRHLEQAKEILKSLKTASKGV